LGAVIVLFWQHLSYHEEFTILFDLVADFVVGVSKVETFYSFLDKVEVVIVYKCQLYGVVSSSGDEQFISGTFGCGIGVG
jgi:hypothetical protein